jgi:hypothetical protein
LIPLAAPEIKRQENIMAFEKAFFGGCAGRDHLTWRSQKKVTRFYADPT